MKGQVAFEALAALGVIMLLFIASYGIYNAKRSDVIRTEILLQEQDDCLKISNGIANALLLGTGTAINTRISHTLIIDPSQQKITTPHAFCTFIHNNVLNTSHAIFNITSGNVAITNNGALITIKNE